MTSDDSISITSEDSYDLTASQQDLRVLHKRMVEERKKEQEAANKEQQRLDDILNICATYQREMEEEMVKQHGGTASGDGGAGHGVARSESRYRYFFLDHHEIINSFYRIVANIYTCPRPHPLYHARTPATSDSASGRYVDDIILAGVVNKNPKI